MATARRKRRAGATTARRRHAPAVRTRAERADAGRALRDGVPRKGHGEWKVRRRRDPIEILERSNRGRLPELVPIRYGRMLSSPFAFLRGSAAVMARDLAATPSSGLRVQACGDCHLLNFGLFATPERRLVFDINDFDETHPAPWEWDVKRLAASFAVAARESGHSEDWAPETVLACAAAYREHVRECADMTPLEVWYENMDAEAMIARAQRCPPIGNRCPTSGGSSSIATSWRTSP